MQRNLSAEKDARQNEKRRVRNRVVRSRSKTLVKDFIAAVEAKKKPEAEKMFAELSSYLDNAVTKGILHRNTAARKKSRMNLLLNKMGS
ncbi:MAG: 30S ribosomal protein S20 [Spirochaetes bacterium RBG_13_68_11]|nr:MAG: 30S ribosomal protein S20 [Spirochaetes bacterium RBG_13_68_11]